MYSPSVYLLIPTDEIGKAWIKDNLQPGSQSLGKGVAIEHRYIQDICQAICEEGIQKHFDLHS